MGRPVYFSQDPENDKLAQDRLATAASRVGFDQIVFQLEPVAAALYFETMLTIPQLVLVADLGGGTTDLTLMKMSPEKVKTANRHQDVLATNGVYIGGDKFDSEIMRHKLVKYFGSEAKWSSYNKWMDMPVHIMSTICDWREIPYLKGGMERRMIRELKHTSNDRDALERLEALIDEDLGFALFQEIENAKTAISSKKSCLIKFKHSIIEIKELVTRLEFNQMIGKYLREIEKCLHELLYRARVSVDDVDKVFLTGGSSNVPAVYELFASTIGSNKVQLGDALTSVVAGLVLSSNMTSGT